MARSENDRWLRGTFLSGSIAQATLWYNLREGTCQMGARRRGFTLIEPLVVFAVAAILVALMPFIRLQGSNLVIATTISLPIALLGWAISGSSE
jgi:prepilin-type N-terminal cleavage/methylation domain-containing protein